MQNKFKEFICSETTINAILARLNEIQKLPENGIVAGQSVSSIIAEMLKIDLIPVINDIDIFYSFGGNQAMSKEVRLFFRTKQVDRSNNLMEIADIIEINSHYEHIGLSYSSAKYSIIGTTRDHMINKVYLDNDNNPSMYNRNVSIVDFLSTFDINSTQVGIDLRTRKIYFTENFITFLISRQLEISNWYSPAHSLIRLVRKNKELGSFINLDESKLLIGIMMSVYKDAVDLTQSNEDVATWLKINILKDINRTTLFFGKKQSEQYKVNVDDLQDFRLAKKVDRKSNFDFYIPELKGDYELHTLLPNNPDKIKDDYLTAINESNFSRFTAKDIKYNSFKLLEMCVYNPAKMIEEKGSIVPFGMILPKIYNSYKNVRKSTCVFINKGYEKDLLKNNCILNQSYQYGLVNINQLNNIDNAQITSFHKKIKNHFREIGYLLDSEVVVDFNALMHVNEVITEVEAEFGQSIYGVISMIQPRPHEYSVEKLRKLMIAARKNKEKILKDRVINYTNGLESIVELVSGLELEKEGIEMNHCVGGYSRAIEDGNSFIFAMRNASGKRMTMELQHEYEPNKEHCFRISQIFGVKNTIIIEDEVSTLLDIVEPIYELSNRDSFFINNSPCEAIPF